MTINEAVSIIRQEMNDCAYDFGSTSYQDRCLGIEVYASGGEIDVIVRMHVSDPSNAGEVNENVNSTLKSIHNANEIPYGVNLRVKYE